MTENTDTEQPTVAEVRRYYTGKMPLEERRQFERRAGSSTAFLERCIEIREILAVLRSVKVETAPEPLAAISRQRLWPERVRKAVAQLRQKGHDLATLAEKGAEAAIELTLNALESPVNTCLREGVSLRFSFASGPVRTRGTIRSGADAAKREGSFETDRITNARVGVDPDGRMVTVQFPVSPLPPVIVLIPEDPANPPLYPTKTDIQSVTFENVPEGRYLLTIPTSD